MDTTIAKTKLAYSVEEAAEALGVSKTTMYQLVRTEGFPVIFVGKKRVIPVESFKHWIEECAAAGRRFK